MRFLWYWVVVLAACLVFGIPFAYTKVLAKFDNFVITDTDLQKRIMIAPERQRAKTVQQKEHLLNQMIDEELLMREAQKLNLCDSDDYKFRVETFKRQLLVNLYLDQYVRENNTEENQRKYYEKNKDMFREDEKVKISVITVGSEDEAKDILRKLHAGEDFAELAKKYSKGPYASKGGDFGWRTRRSLKTEIANAAFSMKKGEISSEPVKTPDGGYSIIKVAEHVAAGILKFENVKRRIAMEYPRMLVKEKIADVRKAAKIEMDAAGLGNIKTE